jgi:hypothetical protein
MAEKVTWFHRVAAFAYLWVREDGTITAETQPFQLARIIGV